MPDHAPGGAPVADVYDADGGYDPYDESPPSGSQPTASPAAAAAASPAAVLRSALVGVLGDVLITLGVIVGLYLAYEFWWSNVTAAQQAARNSTALLHAWQRQPAAEKPSGAVRDGQGFGFLYIPALGADWRALIMQSVDRTSVLNTGAVGHYTGPASAMPWDATGNFALAGHRDGHGMIFRDLDRLAAGDRIYVQTRYGWFVYRLDREAASVPVNDVGAVEPIPAGSGYTAPGRYLTLTTCTPMYVDTNRMVWWGRLIERTPASEIPAGVTPIS